MISASSDLFSDSKKIKGQHDQSRRTEGTQLHKKHAAKHEGTVQNKGQGKTRGGEDK